MKSTINLGRLWACAAVLAATVTGGAMANDAEQPPQDNENIDVIFSDPDEKPLDYWTPDKMEKAIEVKPIAIEGPPPFIPK